MEGFTQTLSLILISCFIINLISSMYPQTKNKHTYMVVISIIIVYICVTPISDFLTNLSDFSEIFESAYQPDYGVNSYWEEGEEYEFVSGVYEDILAEKPDNAE